MKHQTATAVTNSNVYLSTAQAAAHIGCKPQTLRKKRWQGNGPPYVRFGDGPRARVLYRLADLEAWLAERTFINTSEETIRQEE